MTNIWQTVQLGKVMQVEIDAVPVDNQPEFHMAGVYSFARGLFKREPLPNTQTTYKVFHRLHKDMFVISVPKGWEGALARVTDDFDGMFLSPVYPTFRANPKELDIQYFEWYCRQSKVWDELRRKSRGIGARRESISAQQFLTLEIPLPPLTEQRRIVAHIESLAARVNEAQRLREEADSETDVVIKAARNQIIEDLKQKNKTHTLSELCTKITDGPHVSPNYVSKSEGVPFISVRNVNETGLDFSTAQYVSRKDHEEFSKRVNVEKGDVLFHKVGSTGTARRVDIDIEFSIWVNLALLKPKRELIDGAFMEHMLNAPSVREHTTSMTAGSSTQYIGLGKIGKIEIPVPPLDEQRRIVAYLDGL